MLLWGADGVLHTYKWGEWSDCSDRFPGHPESIDAIVAVDADTILTGSSDGLLRVVTIQVRLCPRAPEAIPSLPSCR